MVYFKLGERQREGYSVSDASLATRKKFRILPTGVERMTFRTPVRHSTTDLQETCGS